MATKQPKQKIGEWHQFDASKIVLGRLATQIAHLLMGKHRPDFVPNLVAPVFVVVTNADTLKVTGQKHSQKMYHKFSGYPGGLKSRSLGRQMELDSTKVIEEAVFGMLPKNNLRPEMMKHLNVYATSEHPHSDVTFTNA